MATKIKVIKGPVFDHRGPIPTPTLAQLGIRGGETQVDDALSRWGWSRDTLVAAPVVSTEPGSGKIMGSRWEIRGIVAKYQIAANSLWAEANGNINVMFNLDGKNFKFSNRGTGLPSNFSDFMDMRQGNLVTFKEGDNEADWKDLHADQELNGCVRMEVHVGSVTEAAIYLVWVPLSLEELKTKCESWETDMMSDNIPCAILHTGTEPNIKRSCIAAKLMVQESQGAKIGMGILPLIEQVS